LSQPKETPKIELFIKKTVMQMFIGKYNHYVYILGKLP
jgi:hypothetical protein